MLHSDNLRLSSDGNFAAAGRTSAREENDIHHGGTETQRKATPRIVPATAVLQPPPDFGLFTTEARRHREKQLHELPSDGSFAAAARLRAVAGHAAADFLCALCPLCGLKITRTSTRHQCQLTTFLIFLCASVSPW